jgi:uncharacterized surface protein with fasciclin (FAS1) repeats
MKTQTSPRFLAKTVASVLAAASLFVSLPAMAKSCQGGASANNARTAQTADKAEANKAGTIVEVATANGSFNTLVAAVKAAGLADVLSGEGPFTVFAPTDAAFAALPKGTVENLLKPENRETLKKILTYHVVPGTVKSTDIKTGEVKTVEGSPIKVRVQGRRVTVNNAKVTTADVAASNGVIHVIDKVILPPSD